MTVPFSLQNRTVLLCEPNALILLVLTLALLRLGMDVVGKAQAGEEVVSLALKTRPDFIVIEYRLPDMNGIEASCRILTECSSCILLTTTTTDAQLQEQARSVGIKGLIAKPYISDQLPQYFQDAFTALC